MVDCPSPSALGEISRLMEQSSCGAVSGDQLGILLDGVWQARCAILAVYDRECGTVASKVKADASPVTEADWEADRILRATLVERMGYENRLVVSEEQVAAPDGLAGLASDGALRFFVDPVDGTREFLRRSGQFVICVGAVQQQKPVFGLIHAPVTGETMMGWPARPGGEGCALAFRLKAGKVNPGALWRWGIDGLRSLRAQRDDATNPAVLKVLLSGTAPGVDRAAGVGGGLPSPMAAAFEASQLPYRTVRMGSALKFCHIAGGMADVYLRSSPTSYWDTVAGQALVESVGGRVLMLQRQKGERCPVPVPMTYGETTLENPPFAVFRAGLSFDIQDRLMSEIARRVGAHESRF